MGLDSKGSEDKMAVVVRNAVKSYEKKGPNVLDKLNMSVSRGCIYGLLGASGAGKTTLLTAVVGLLKLDSGELRVLGGVPGEKDSGIPGPRVGFMPQETALVGEFTIRDAFQYFGLLYGMSHSEVRERFEFFSKLLQLPKGQSIIKTLSGGQARRVSLSVCLMQNPELIILDEPTVGQDPLLRQSIWKYLVELSEVQRKTIIITTHYIEEAKDAHKIGILRHGTLLAEASPSFLLTRFNCESLEDVFLILSTRQTELRNAGASKQLGHNGFEMTTTSSSSDVDVLSTQDGPDPYEFSSQPPPPETIYKRTSTINKMRALLYKNFFKILRNYPNLTFTLSFPILHILCFFYGVGRVPQNIPIAVVNEELGDCWSLPGGLGNHSGVHLLPSSPEEGAEELCQLTGISCLYLDLLHKDQRVKSYYHNTVDEALSAIKNGKVFSAVYIQKNFSLCMQQRYYDAQSMDDETLNMNEIKIWMDMTDFYISTTLKKHYMDIYSETSNYITRGCNSSSTFTLPVKFNDPIYGSNKSEFTLYMAPAMTLGVSILLTTMFSTSAILLEKVEGIWGRNIVAGVTPAEIIGAHLLSHSCVILVQNAEMLLLCFYWFDMYLLGNVWTMLGIVFLQSIMGSTFGLTISCLVGDLYTANIMSMSSVFPYVISSGTLWPVEGMPRALQVISHMLPGLSPTKAFQSVLYRGWSITHPDVYNGYLMTLLWIGLFSSVCVFMIRRAKH